MHGVGYGLVFHLEDFVIDEPFVAVFYAVHFIAVCHCKTKHCTDCRVHARSVSAAREHCKFFVC